MAVSIPNNSPIYFPTLQSRYDGITNEQASGEAILSNGELVYEWGNFIQEYAQTDEIFLQLRVDGLIPVYTIRLTQYLNGEESDTTFPATSTPVNPSGEYFYNFHIPLNAFSGEFTLTIEESGVGDVGTSVRMKIHPADCDRLSLSRLIEYAYLGCGRDRSYFEGDENTPTNTYKLRLPAVLQFDSRSSELTSSLGSDGTWDYSAARSYVVENLETGSWKLPDYMHRLMSLVLLHRYLTIDGTRFVIHSDWRANAPEDRETVREGSGQVKRYSSYE